MKKILLFIIVILIYTITLLYSDRVAAPWSDPNIKKYIAIHPGTTESVWENRAAITNGLMEMQPVGDGTYEAVVPLVPGARYNYLLFAKTEENTPDGLQPWTTYFDCIPTSGYIQNSTGPDTVIIYDSVNISPVRYTEVEWYNEDGHNKDARRFIEVPEYLNAGDSFYVFNNFADKPHTVGFFNATATNDTTVVLSWGAPYGAWGSFGESAKAADVIAGGEYKIFRNSPGETNVFELLATIAGNIFTYRDTDLAQGTTYYYTIMIKDAYQGADWTHPFVQMQSDTITPVSVTPNPPIDVYLKVEGMDYDYIRSSNYNVFLTPSTAENKYFARRFQGKLTRIEL